MDKGQGLVRFVWVAGFKKIAQGTAESNKTFKNFNVRLETILIEG